jgi:hypothetical protein
VPASQLYGSDELTRSSDVIGERLTGPYVALATVDAKRLGVGLNSVVSVAGLGGERDYPACIRESVRPGTLVVFDGSFAYPVAETGATVSLTVREGEGDGRFDNLIVSDLQSGRVAP